MLGPFFVVTWSARSFTPKYSWERHGEVHGEDLCRTTDAAISLAVGAVQAYQGPVQTGKTLTFDLNVSVQRWPNYESYSNYKARCGSDRTVQLDPEDGGPT